MGELGFPQRATLEAEVRRALLWASLLLLVLIIYVSLLPFDLRPQTLHGAIRQFFDAPPIDPANWVQDESDGHALAYGLWAFLFMGGLHRSGYSLNPVLAALGVCAAAVGLSCVLEVGQAFIVGRGVSANDAYAGSAGAFVGVVVWLALGPVLLSFAARMMRGGVQSFVAAGLVYALVYVSLLLFPFDFLLSLDELAVAGKPLMAFAGADAGPARNFAAIVLKIGLALPLGLVFLRWPLAAVAVMAVLVGLGGELIKYALATGQGTLASALARAVGLGLGWWAARRLLAFGKLPRLSPPLRRSARVLALVGLVIYGVFLILLDRWSTGARPSPAAISALLADVRWMPFYYYYRGAAVSAVTSLLAQVAVFVPVGVLVWGLRWRGGWQTVLLAAGTGVTAAFFLQVGRVVVAGFRPDLTTCLLAAVGAAGGAALVSAVVAWGRHVFDQPAARESVAFPLHWRFIPAGLLALVALAIVLDHPGGNAWLLGGLVFYAIILKRYPEAWLIVLPAALPVLDFLPLTGRIMLDPFDALIFLTLAAEVARQPLPRAGFGWRGAMAWIMFGLVTAYVLGALNGLLPLPPLDANAFTSLYSRYQVLWVAKGFLYALALTPFFWRLVRADPLALIRLAYGMGTGLFLCGLVVLWERYLFTGLFNMAADYRALGAFSTMRVGGAHLDAYLVMALPFAAVPLLVRRNLGAFLMTAALVLIGLYGVFATSSRAPFLAVMVSALVLGLGLFIASRHRGGQVLRFFSYGVIAVGLGAAATLPFLSDSFLAKRFATAEADANIRFAHWAHVLAIRDLDPLSQWFGMGPGRLPAVYQNYAGARPFGVISLGAEGPRHFARFTGGQSVYLSQFIRVRPHERYRLTVVARANHPRAALSVPLCEKWIAGSFDCVWQTLGIGDTHGEWREIVYELTTRRVGSARGAAGWISTRPVKLTLYSGVRDTIIDVADIQLTTAGGRELVANGNFARNLDHWYVSVDDPLTWHSNGMLAGLLFDQGYVGFVLFMALVGLVAVRLVGQIAGGDRLSAVFLAAIAAFLVIGLIDSPFDVPRLTLLVYFLLFAAYALGEVLRPEVSAKP